MSDEPSRKATNSDPPFGLPTNVAHLCPGMTLALPLLWPVSSSGVIANALGLPVPEFSCSLNRSHPCFVCARACGRMLPEKHRSDATDDKSVPTTERRNCVEVPFPSKSAARDPSDDISKRDCST